ncbi:MAG TPA: hypothetical protein VMI54_07835 [Polyangiaceae bacterium]|nr:hypothetical protein [Polyangiaceae bacterium]
MPIGSAFVLASTVALAGAQNLPPSNADTADAAGPFSDRVRDAWTLSLEGVTRAPLEAGFQAGVEMPFGLRLFGGYAWVPSEYIDFLATLAAGRDAAQAVLQDSHYGGNSARVGAGLRPFHDFGLYFDASYAHVRLDATQPIPSFSVPGYDFPGGTYRLHTGLDMWSLELGYEAEMERRVVLAIALGASGAFGSSTKIVPLGGAPNESTALWEASGDIDHVFRTNVLPTLTLRLGFDLI